MSVVVWDGKSIAADKRAVCNGVSETSSKMRVLAGGEVVAWCGPTIAGLTMLNWFQGARNPETFPDLQRNNAERCDFIVATAEGCRLYENSPFPIPVEDDFCAWGSGRDIALGALLCGKNAKESVEITCMISIHCGNGVEVHHFNQA